MNRFVTLRDRLLRLGFRHSQAVFHAERIARYAERALKMEPHRTFTEIADNCVSALVRR